MFTFFKIGELPRGRFVFKDIEGKDWHAEVKSRNPDRDTVRGEFYQKRAALKLKVDPNSVVDNLKKGKDTGYKTLKQLKDSGKNPTYDVPKMPAGMNAEKTKEYFGKGNSTPNTLFKILKDYFTKVGVGSNKVEKEVLLSLHYLRWWKGINVDYLDGGEKVIIDGGHISIIKADGKTKRVGPTPLRPEVEASAVPAPKVEPPKPPDKPAPKSEPPKPPDKPAPKPEPPKPPDKLAPKPKPADLGDVPPSPRSGAKAGPPVKIPSDVQ